MPPVTPQQPTPPARSGAIPPAGPAPAGFGGGVKPTPASNPPAPASRLPFIIYGVLGVVIVALIGGLLYTANQLSQAKQANSSQFEEGRKTGQQQQKEADEQEDLRASLSDTRSYVAPKELGEFSFSLPKSFSMSSTTVAGGNSTPLVLLANPDRVETTSKFQALRVTVKNSLFSRENEAYTRLAKDAKVGLSEPENLKIDDWNAVRYTGKFDRRDKTGTVVLIEVRDKTYFFQTDNNEAQDLLDAFNQTLNSIRIQ